MKMRYSVAFLLAMQVGAAHAYQNEGLTLTPDSVYTGAVRLSGMETSSADDNRIQVNNWYSIQSNVVLQVMEPQGVLQPNVNIPENGLLDLGQGTELNVMEISADSKFVLIGIDDDIAEENAGVVAEDPTVAWVRIEDLSRSILRSIDAEMIDQLGQPALVEQVQDQLADTAIASRRGGRAHRRGGRRRGGMTYCLRDVRLTAARFTRRVPQGIAMASRAYGPYKAAGWHPVAYSSSNPIGTACFFSGGRSCGRGTKCGHAAIKISANAWKGAGVRPTPFLAGRSLIGCLTPP